MVSYSHFCAHVKARHLTSNSCKTLIWVHSTMAYPMLNHTPLVAGNLLTKKKKKQLWLLGKRPTNISIEYFKRCV